MQTIHDDRGMRSYGSPRRHRELAARGEHCSENTVAKLMRSHGIRAASSRKLRVRTDSNHSLPVSPKRAGSGVSAGIAGPRVAGGPHVRVDAGRLAVSGLRAGCVLAEDRGLVDA